MQNPQQLCFVEHPVGIDSRAQDIISALRLSDPAFSIVAVLGMSGSGKTTIAKAVYDRIAADFNVSCFIQDINSYLYRGPNWKVDLQRDVISCLTGNDKFIASHNDGAAMIIKLISGQKLFLVLDDVYTYEQLQALSIPSASFHCESRIIVTTRNAQSLSNLQHTSYNIELLDTSESFELFTRLIGTREPMEKKFVDEIVECAGGLPLVLEVWSRHFIDYDKKLWPRMLETLKRIPHEDTQKKLRIVYDLLPKRAQNLFLDIACFFNGMDKDTIVKVLQDEDFFPDVEIQIQNLVHKFLVKNDSDDEYEPKQLLLHDVIREMGQEVVRQEDEVEPGKRTRLMGYKDVVRVLRDCSGTDSVRSIWLYSSEKEERVTVQLEAFRKMGNLRFIMLVNLGVTNILEWSSSSNDDMSCYTFKHLKYLEWRHFPCKSLDNIDMGNVVVIRLHHSKLEKLWEGVKSFKKLNILDVEGSRFLAKTGNFSEIENLEKLRLGECENLEELDSSIGCLQKLVILNLTRCKRLKSLPWEMIGKLTSLQNLSLYYCSNIREISHEVGNLISLKYLDLRNTSFSSLPNSLCQLHQLTTIDLSVCTNLKSIPDLPLNIKYLEARDCINLVNLPSNISELQNLKKLMLNGCFKLGSEGFTQVTGLRNLQELYMISCNVSQVSSRIGNLMSLRILYLSKNTFSRLPESFSNLSKLEELHINRCSELQLLPPLPSQLTDINATYCCSLDVMPFDFRQKAYSFRSKVFKELLTGSEGFHIGLSEEEVPEWCTHRNSGNVLSFVAPLHFHHNKICGLIFCATTNYYQNFSTIHIKTKEKSHRMQIKYHQDCTLNVVFYPLNDKTVVVEAGDTVELRACLRPPEERIWLSTWFFGYHVKYHLLILRFTVVVSYVSYFNKNLVLTCLSFKKLKILDVGYSSSITKTGNFTEIENLEKLYLNDCYNLEELDSSIGCLQKLVVLDLKECKRLKMLPWEMIGKLTSLQYLYLSDCPNLPEISHEVGSLISLDYLDLWGNRFNNLPNSLCQLHQLTKIELSECTNLKSIPDLPPSIEELIAEGCVNLVNLPSNCSELQFLTELWLNDCCKLGSEGFTQVTRVRNLQQLEMKNCNISQVSSRIGNLVSLVSLDLSGNTFSSLPESFSNLSELEHLYIDRCSQLKLLPPLPSQLTDIKATECWSLDVMPFDLRQKAYTFRSKVFKELVNSTEGLQIGLSGEELPEWCTFRNSGNVLSFVAPLNFHHNKICGLIICATTNDHCWNFLTIHNKTKKSHRMETRDQQPCSLYVMFYPLNDNTVVVEAGDTVELRACLGLQRRGAGLAPGSSVTM
ncbi:TMV resistance protein N [Artemisia annua]|uniref:TMV resistance protein N n=1 Tax=Artemisia annua TaxID=35608 RepID=A0A2U1PJD2_ARTAN|nr:TMV resistance protein N [Artemisia annua]